MSGITTHVLDTSAGRPAAGVPVTLEMRAGDGWKLVGEGTTNSDGRISDLMSNPAEAGVYRIVFDTGIYFRNQQQQAFYPSVTVVFRIEDGAQHYHVPLLLSPFGYSTYRGS
jgi:5-hydroxyisourate hydrolase